MTVEQQILLNVHVYVRRCYNRGRVTVHLARNSVPSCWYFLISLDCDFYGGRWYEPTTVPQKGSPPNHRPCLL